MSSYEKPPSCNNRSPRSHVFRDAFTGCLVVFVEQSHLTKEPRYAIQIVANVADDYTPVPKSAFFRCIRATSSKPEELSNVHFTLVVFRCVVQGSFPLTFVIQCQACL